MHNNDNVLNTTRLFHPIVTAWSYCDIFQREVILPLKTTTTKPQRAKAAPRVPSPQPTALMRALLVPVMG